MLPPLTRTASHQNHSFLYNKRRAFSLLCVALSWVRAQCVHHWEAPLIPHTHYMARPLPLHHPRLLGESLSPPTEYQDVSIPVISDICPSSVVPHWLLISHVGNWTPPTSGHMTSLAIYYHPSIRLHLSLL